MPSAAYSPLNGTKSPTRITPSPFGGISKTGLKLCGRIRLDKSAKAASSASSLSDGSAPIGIVGSVGFNHFIIGLKLPDDRIHNRICRGKIGCAVLIEVFRGGDLELAGLETDSLIWMRLMRLIADLV